MNSYLLAYDLATTLPIAQQLQAYVKANRSVSQWMQPFNGIYLLKSHSDLQTLEAGFNEFFAGRTLHMLIPLYRGHTQGVMPPYVWEWLNQTEESSLNALISGLLGAAIQDEPR